MSLFAAIMVLWLPLSATTAAREASGMAHAPGSVRLHAEEKASDIPQWRWQNPLPHGNPLSTVDCPDRTVCYAAGNGTVMISHNAGKTWASTYDRGRGQILALACPERDACYAVGLHGASASIMGTFDGGTTWLTLKETRSAPLTHISCPNRRVCYAMGTYSALLITRDGGRTWRSITPPLTLASIACPAVDVCYAPITTNLITSPPPGVVVTRDGGRTWARHSVGIARGAGQLTSIHCASVTTCFVVAYANVSENPFLVKTTTGGISWAWRHFPKNSYFRASAIACPTASRCYLAGENGTARGILLYTRDGGETWTRGAYLPIVVGGMACTRVRVCVAVGTGGSVLRTVNSWSSWTSEIHTVTIPAVSTSDYSLRSIACSSAPVCYSAGDFGMIAKTTDGGRTWTRIRASLAGRRLTNRITSLACSDHTTCFAGIVYPATATWSETANTVISTRDGARTWSMNPGRGFAVVACPTARLCYAGGVRGGFSISQNGGMTWKHGQSPLPRTYTILRIVCPTSTTCYATAIGPYDAPMHDANHVGSILSTSDAGRTWRRTDVDPYPSALACRTTTDCFALLAHTNGPALVTHDGGLSWHRYVSLPPGMWNDIACEDSRTCYLAGMQGDIAVTRDGGQTWTGGGSPTFNRLTAIRCTGAGVCYAVGANGTILSTR